MKFLPLLLYIFMALTIPISLAAEETIRVAAIFAKTGKAAAENRHSLEGVRFAIEEVNNQGGVLGKKLELLEFDNKSTAIGKARP